jgi:uncharacterized protein (DUF1919 family)
MKIAVISFEVGYNHYKPYDFKTDLDLKEGDLVVCDTARGYNVGQVVGIKESSKSATKWIVCKVDLEAHQKRLEHEKKLAEIKAKMEQRRKKLESLQIYRMLAQEDPEMAKLLKEYEELQ